jgi:hypothetical protein
MERWYQLHTSDGVMERVQKQLLGMNRLAHGAEAWTSLREEHTPHETCLLLVQACPGGDDKRTGEMNGSCAKDVHGEAEVVGQYGSRLARIEGEMGMRTKNQQKLTAHPEVLNPIQKHVDLVWDCGCAVLGEGARMVDAVQIGLWGDGMSMACRAAVLIYPFLRSRSGLEHYSTYSLCVGRSGSLRKVLEPRDEVQSK